MTKRPLFACRPKMKAAAEMVSKFTDKKKSAEKPKLARHGKKETVNGYETEEYVYEAPEPQGNLLDRFQIPMGLPFLKSCNR